jgi:hypothetical protein
MVSHCNAQLSGLVDIEQQIVDLGYQIVAIAQMRKSKKIPRRKIKSNTKYFLG